MLATSWSRTDRACAAEWVMKEPVVVRVRVEPEPGPPDPDGTAVDVQPRRERLSQFPGRVPGLEADDLREVAESFSELLRLQPGCAGSWPGRHRDDRLVAARVQSSEGLGTVQSRLPHRP